MEFWTELVTPLGDDRNFCFPCGNTRPFREDILGKIVMKPTLKVPYNPVDGSAR